MSKFFKALEQAERDNVQREPLIAEEAARERVSVVPQWPEPSDEQPPVFPPPPPPRAPRPVAEATRVGFETSRIAPALLDEHLVSLQAPATAAAEQYRVLRHLVETLRNRANLQVIAVTSGGAGDGKSVTAINLAGALAQSDDARVLLAEARQQYDYVVLDTPPFVPFPDCRLLAKCVDGFVLVVASNRTPRGVLAEALKAMDSEKAVGYVFNAHPMPPSTYYGDGDGRGRARPWRRNGERS